MTDFYTQLVGDLINVKSCWGSLYQNYMMKIPDEVDLNGIINFLSKEEASKLMTLPSSGYIKKRSSDIVSENINGCFFHKHLYGDGYVAYTIERGAISQLFISETMEEACKEYLACFLFSHGAKSIIGGQDLDGNYVAAKDFYKW